MSEVGTSSNVRFFVGKASFTAVNTAAFGTGTMNQARKFNQGFLCSRRRSYEHSLLLLVIVLKSGLYTATLLLHCASAREPNEASESRKAAKCAMTREMSALELHK